MIIVFSTPIHSGKTTALIKWSAGEQVYGIFSPVVEGRRVFMDAATKEQFPMETEAGEEVLTVGRFRFRKAGFQRASQIIREAIDKPGWLVIDEIGPLELRGEGFCDVLREVLGRRKERIILVVREGMGEEVEKYFGVDAISVGTVDLFERDSESFWPFKA